MSQNYPLPPIVSPAEWSAALADLLVKEKELTKMRDAVAAQRRRMPMVKIEKAYEFDGEAGTVNLLDLFDGRKQLIVYHFMFGPDWEAGCEGCSWVVDAMSHPAHLRARDTNLVLVSRAPLVNLLAYRQRMGWDMPWVSSLGTGFNVDFGATKDGYENHCVSVLIRDADDNIYRTYFSENRGVDYLGSHWTYLDLTPYGRQEDWEDSPEGWPQTPTHTWTKRHDEYDLS